VRPVKSCAINEEGMLHQDITDKIIKAFYTVYNTNKKLKISVNPSDPLDSCAITIAHGFNGWYR
jgi:hypothetical protein